MAHIEINVPESLRYQLESISENEGVPLNQYIVYALTRQVALMPLIHHVSENDVKKQHKEFMQRIKSLGTASSDELEKIMEDREPADSESDLNPDVIFRFKQRIAEAKTKLRDKYDEKAL